MRITGPGRPGGVSANAPARRTGSGQFSLEAADSPRAASQTAAPRSVGGIDALLALQGVEEPTERRRRAIKRGRNALDALDGLKLGLLSGTLDTPALARLKAAATALGERTGEVGLDTILAEIALRVEVELAKVGKP
jgi:hypothetical protein